MEILGDFPDAPGASAFRIEDVLVVPQQNLLRRAGRHAALEAKTMGVLTHLADNAGEVVTREGLLDRVWGELRGSDEALSRAVSLCRSAFALLGAADPIRTVPRKGYALIAEIVPEGTRAQRLTPADSQARALYLRGRTKAAQIANPAELAEAVSLLEQATNLDPSFAPGWAALANAQAIAAGHTPFGDRLMQIRKAGNSANRAIELDYRQHLAHSVRAQLLLAERDIVGAIDAANIARSIAATDADAAMWLGYIYSVIGLFDRALPLLELAVALDPLQGRRHMILAIVLVASAEYEAGEKSALQAIELGFFAGHEPYAAAAFMRGEPELAVSRFSDAIEDFSRVYKREAKFKYLIGLAAKGVYGESQACKHLLLSAAIAAAKIWKGSPEGLLSYIFLRLGSAGAFFNSFGTRILPGNSIVLPYLFDNSERSASVRKSTGFDQFATNVGMRQAWDSFGLPNCFRESL